MTAYTKLTFTQRELLAAWLRQNYVANRMTDAQALEQARAALGKELPDLTLQHLTYLRDQIGIAKNYAYKPKSEAPAQAKEPQADRLDNLVHLIELQQNLIKSLNQSVAQLGQPVGGLEQIHTCTPRVEHLPADDTEGGLA